VTPENKEEIKTPIEKIVEHAVEKEKTPSKNPFEYIKKPTERIMSKLKEKGEKFKQSLGEKLYYGGEKIKEMGDFLHEKIEKHKGKIEDFTYAAAALGIGGIVSNLLGHNLLGHMHTVSPETIKSGLETIGAVSTLSPYVAKGVRTVGHGISKLGEKLKKPTEKIINR
jgi:hypothetical protein